MSKNPSARRRIRHVLAVALFAMAGQLGAQQLLVGSGASLSLGSSTIDAGCRNLDILGTLDIGTGAVRNARDVAASGTLRGGSGVLALNGDLAAASALQPQSGTVTIGDGCDRTASRITGDHLFNSLRIEIANDHTVIFPANGTQTIAQALALQGGLSRVVLQSSVFGAVSYLALAQAGSQFVNRVDAIDVGAPPTAQFLAPSPPAAYDSIDRGNTPRFFGDFPVVPVPALSFSGLLALMALVGLLAARQLAGNLRSA